MTSRAKHLQYISFILLIVGIATLSFLRTTSGSTQDDPTKWTLEQWKSWRDSKIADILTPTPVPNSTENLIDRERVIDKCAEVNQILSPILQNDPEFFRKDPELNKAMSNFVAFVRAQSLMFPNNNSKHHLGMSVTDEEYWAAAKDNLIFPDLLKSQNFLKLMADPSTYAQAVAAIEHHNATLPDGQKWIYLPFEAQFIKSIRDEGHGRTYGRLLVLVPRTPTDDGGTLDRWFLFSLATPDQPVAGDIRPVSLISVRNPPPGATGVTPRQKVFFMDFIRERVPESQDIQLTPSVLSPGHVSKNCFDCHKSAILPIKPRFEFEFVNGQMVKKAENDGVVATIANRFISLYRKKYSLPDWGFLDPEAYGPSMGPDGRVRTDEFIRMASGDLNLPASSYDNVRIAMDCASCHQDFAPLNYLTAVRTNRDVNSFRRGEGIVQTYLEEGWMPPGFGLTALERKALWRCLIAEYFDLKTQSGILVNWLKGIDPNENKPDELLKFNDQMAFISAFKVARSKSGTLLKTAAKVQELPRLGVEDLRLGTLALKQRRFKQAEALLWRSYSALHANGIRSSAGLTQAAVVLQRLDELYRVWTVPESLAGAKRLKLIKDASGHE